jgi:hypothetical protein
METQFLLCIKICCHVSSSASIIAIKPGYVQENLQDTSSGFQMRCICRYALRQCAVICISKEVSN